MSAYNAGDPGSIPGWGRSSGEGNGNPLQYSCVENPMGGAWWAAIYGVTKSRPPLKQLSSSSSINEILPLSRCMIGTEQCATFPVQFTSPGREGHSSLSVSHSKTAMGEFM